MPQMCPSNWMILHTMIVLILTINSTKLHFEKKKTW